VAVEIVNHAAFALKAAADDVEKANPVAFLVALVLDRLVHFFDISGAFVTESGLMELVDVSFDDTSKIMLTVWPASTAIMSEWHKDAQAIFTRN
jgi:hypothetical protein